MMIIDMTPQFAPILSALDALLVVSALALVADAAGFLRGGLDPWFRRAQRALRVLLTS